MSDLLQVPSSSPPAWAARFAMVRAAVTPVRVVLAVVGLVAAVAFGLVFLRTPAHPAELVLPKAGDVPVGRRARDRAVGRRRAHHHRHRRRRGGGHGPCRGTGGGAWGRIRYRAGLGSPT